MRKVLIVYYSQTGQLTEIVNSVVSPFRKANDFDLVFEELKPKKPFPFPWSGEPFFQVFPESVKGIPCELEPFGLKESETYDLVILAYQSWYLSPSIPFNSFLQSSAAKNMINETPVITIIGCRNMWIMSQEYVKRKISEFKGRLAGNIVLTDKTPNLISVLTFVRWLIYGRRKGTGIWGRLMPRAGVSEQDIKNASVFGDLILKSIRENDLNNLQLHLVENGAVKVNPVLMSIEKRGYIMFRIWSDFILKKGNYGDPARNHRLRIFKYYLFIVLYLISPVASLIFYLVHIINKKNRYRLIQKYSGLEG